MTMCFRIKDDVEDYIRTSQQFRIWTQNLEENNVHFYILHSWLIQQKKCLHSTNLPPLLLPPALPHRASLLPEIASPPVSVAPVVWSRKPGHRHTGEHGRPSMSCTERAMSNISQPNYPLTDVTTASIPPGVSSWRPLSFLQWKFAA